MFAQNSVTCGFFKVKVCNLLLEDAYELRNVAYKVMLRNKKSTAVVRYAAVIIFPRRV